MALLLWVRCCPLLLVLPREREPFERLAVQRSAARHWEKKRLSQRSAA